ncbi:RNA-binding protein 48 [Callorhinchus milii]|uniref:RNA-binding protein 48 n=1 Tax=Callorhinchus milii TaxID=7868 RepID=A0A4W3JP99_CALMI|nr:RNA-binding protein 48 [Callorhinchus milii]|eukprot:gi/632937840/ref/XP_007901284.1/ PREDICTED: RNA-binding protein 48 [Callorhinchus milii]
MAAPAPEVHKHHQQKSVCFTRPKYREGRRLRAVKVYTINLESRHLLIQGVPAIGVMKELVELFALYGTIEEYSVLDEYPAEEFTEVYKIKYQRLQSARIAKRKLDERSFFGSLLHVCYAPEFETVEDTRAKLKDRRRYIARATKQDVDLHKIEKKPDNSVPLQNPHMEVLSKKPELFGGSEPNQEEWNTGYSMYDYPMLPPPPQPDYQLPKGRQMNCLGYPPVPMSHATSPKDFNISPENSAGFRSELPWFPNRKLHKPEEFRRAEGESCSFNVIECTSSLKRNVSRFVPRTAQLQNRKRMKEQMTMNAFGDLDSDRTAVLIGPKLPQVQKVDLGDNSLNVSANMIRNKLTEVLSVPTTATEKNEAPQTKAPKQRRRI